MRAGGEPEIAIEVCGERLVLLPERAVFWRGTETLLVADTHWGKAATFRAAGLPMPPGTTLQGLARMEAALERARPRRVIFLGDFLHAAEGRTPYVVERISEWRASHPWVEMVLVRGNHDRRAGDPPPDTGIRCADPPLHAPPFALCHHPGCADHPFFIAGHLHPAVRLSGPARQRERLPCFWLTPRGLVLPAFGEFTGMADIRPGPEDRVFITASDGVIEVQSVGLPHRGRR